LGVRDRRSGLARSLARRGPGSQWNLGQLDEIPTPADPARTAAIRDSAAARRIGELSALGRGLDVRRKWYHLTAGMQTKGLGAAAVGDPAKSAARLFTAHSNPSMNIALGSRSSGNRGGSRAVPAA